MPPAGFVALGLSVQAAAMASTMAIGFGISAASFAIQNFVLKDKGTFGNSNERNFQVNGSSTETYLPVIYGKAKIGMNIVFRDTHPKSKDWLFTIGAISHGQIKRVKKIYANDEIIATYNNKKKKWVVDDEYTGLIIGIQVGKGSDQGTYYQYVGDLFDAWSDDKRGKGVASIAFELRSDPDKFPGGIPTITLLVDGNAKVYDPRDGTKKYTDNFALCYLDALRNKRYGDAIPKNEIDFDNFAAMANYCDEWIEGDPIEPATKCKPKIKTMDCNLEKDGIYNYKVCATSTWSSYDKGGGEIVSSSTSLSAASQVTITTKKGRVSLTITPSETNKENVDKFEIYRTKAGGSTYYLAREISYDSEDTEQELTVIDNLSDADLEINKLYDSGYGWGEDNTPGTPSIAATYTAYSSDLDLNKYYRYKIVYGNKDTPIQYVQGGVRSKAIKTKKGKKFIRLNAIAISDDNGVNVRVIYRTEGMTNATDDNDTNTNYKYLYTIDDNDETEEYLDYLADSSLGGTGIGTGGADNNPYGFPTTCPSAATLTSGQQRRHTVNGIMDTSKHVLQNLEEMLGTAVAKCHFSGGKWRLDIRRPTVAEQITLNKDNVIGDWSFTLPGAESLCNYVKAAYINPKANYQTDYVVFPPKQNLNQYLIDDNRFENVKEIDLPYINDSRKAQIIAMITRGLSRQGITATLKVKEELLKARVGSVLKSELDTPGWDGKKFWIEGFAVGMDFTNYVTLREYNADAFDRQYLEADAPDDTDTNLPDATEPPEEVLAVTFEDSTYISNGTTIPRIKCSFTNPTSPFWDYSEVYIQKNEGDWEYYTQIDKVDSGVFYIDNVQEGATYYFVFLSVSTLGVREAFSAAAFDRDDADNLVTVWPSTAGHTVGNITAPSDIVGSTIEVSVNGNAVSAKWTYDLGSVSDFDYFDVYICVDATYGTMISQFQTKATYAYFTMPAGTYYLLVQAVDTAGNKSNTASPYPDAPSFTIVSSASWATIITANFLNGTHDGTEEYTYGAVDRLRVKQNQLANPSFSTDLTGWLGGVGTWARSTSYYPSAPASLKGSASGTNMYIDARTTDNPNMLVELNKWYIFTAKVSSPNSPNVRISMLLDNIAGEVNSSYVVPAAYNQWDEVSVISQTQGSLVTTPRVRLKRDSETPGKDAWFDDCKFTRYRAEYQSPTYDRADIGNEVTKVFKFSYTPETAASTKGRIYVDLGYCALSNFSSGAVWINGLESQEITATLAAAEQYIRYRVRFVSVWPDEKIEVLETNCSLQWADPDIAAGTQVITTAYIPFGQGSTTFGESQYFAWETP